MFKTYWMEGANWKETNELPEGNYIEWGYAICEQMCVQEEMEDCIDCPVASRDFDWHYNLHCRPIRDYRGEQVKGRKK